MAVPVFLDPSDASNPPPGATPGICLTPAARLAAERIGLDPVHAVFADDDHAACVAAAGRAVEEFDAHAPPGALPESVRVVSRQSAWQLAAIAHRLVRSLPAAGCAVRGGDGTWSEAGDPQRALEVLLPRVLEWGLAHRSTAARPPAAAVHRWLALRRASRLGREVGWVLTPNRKLKLGLEAELRSAGGRIASLLPTSGTWGDHLRLLRGGTALGVAPVAADDTSLRGCMAALAGMAASYSDPMLRSAWIMYLPYFKANIALALAILREAPQLMGRLGAMAAVSYEGNSWVAAALLDAARASGRRSIVANHNSHAKTGSATADAVLAFLFAQRTANPLVSLSGQWSPHWREWTQARGVDFLPYRPTYPASPAAGKRFRILHAGNYQNWSDFIPWIAETSDEYVNGLRVLAGVMGQLPDADLLIRVRTKPEVDPEIVARAVPSQPNVTVVDTQREFLAQMAESDLLVCHFSTTAEQALQMGKPVLLWGSTQRYCQFKPSWEPPSAARRAPVYAARSAADLAPMLAAIRDQHWHRPLSAEEAAPFRNRPEDPDLAGLASRLLSGA